MVFLNFSDSEQTLSVPFPAAGVYRELLDDDVRRGEHREITIRNKGDFHLVTIPSNYGQIFVTPGVS